MCTFTHPVCGVQIKFYLLLLPCVWLVDSLGKWNSVPGQRPVSGAARTWIQLTVELYCIAFQHCGHKVESQFCSFRERFKLRLFQLLHLFLKWVPPMQLLFIMGFPLFYFSFFMKSATTQTHQGASSSGCELCNYIFAKADRKLCFSALIRF